MSSSWRHHPGTKQKNAAASPSARLTTSSMRWRNVIVCMSIVETIEQKLPIVYAQKIDDRIISTIDTRNSPRFAGVTSPKPIDVST